MDQEPVHKSTISIKNSLKPLRKLISSSKILFLCNELFSNESLSEELNSSKISCNFYLFQSQHIEAIFLLDKNKVGFILDVKRMSGAVNFTLKGNRLCDDNEINQSDCIFQYISCKKCGNVIGRFFHSTSQEKIMLNDKALILINSLKCINIEGDSPIVVDMKSLVKFKQNEIDEIIEVSEINQVLAETVEYIMEDVENTKKFSKTFEHFKSSESLLENISKLARYIEYRLDAK
jgi:hypothetical protein